MSHEGPARLPRNPAMPCTEVERMARAVFENVYGVTVFRDLRDILPPAFEAEAIASAALDAESPVRTVLLPRDGFDANGSPCAEFDAPA